MALLDTYQYRLLKLSFLLPLLFSHSLAVTFKEQPVSTEVSFGDSVTLNCAIEGNLEGVSVFWWNINTSRAFTDNSRISPTFISQDQQNRYSIAGNSSLGEFHLYIRDTTFEDRATLACRAWDGTQWLFSKMVNLNVVRATPDCTMQANLPVDVGDSVRLICRSYSTDPNVELHWLSRGRFVQKLPNLSSTSRSVIQHVLTENDYDVPFMCLQTGSDQRKSCNIVPLHRQLPVIVQDRITSVYDGDTASFHCTTGFAKDSLTFAWYVNGDLRQETTDYLEFPVGISNNGSRVTCKVQDSISGLSGENDAMLLVGPRPLTTTVAPTTNHSNVATTSRATTSDTKESSGITSSNSNLKNSTLRAIPGSKINPKTKSATTSNIVTETTTVGETQLPVLLEEIEIEGPHADGSGKTSVPFGNNFMTAFIVGSVLIGMLLVTVIVILLLFLARQSRQGRSNANGEDGEKGASNGENVPLGTVETDDSMDPNAGIIHKSSRNMKGKHGIVKETNVDYAILDPNAVEEDSLSDFRISDELLDVNCDYDESNERNRENVHRSYSAGIRDSTASSVSAYAIANLTSSTFVSNTPPLPVSARPSQRHERSSSCRSLQRPLPAEPGTPLLKSTQKRYTYITPLEIRNESSERANPVHTSPPVSPRRLDEQPTFNLEALGEEDYAEIHDMEHKSSTQIPQEQMPADLTRLKSFSEVSMAPSVESQEADSALGSGSSMEALTLGDECPYATIGDEQSQNRLNHNKEPSAPPSLAPNTDLDDMVIVSIQDIEEAKHDQTNHPLPVSKKSKTPVYAKVDKSKKRQKSGDSVKSGGPKSPKSPKSLKNKVGKTLSWQSWLEGVVSHGSTDDSKNEKESSIKDTSEPQQTAAYATVWPNEQVTSAS